MFSSRSPRSQQDTNQDIQNEMMSATNYRIGCQSCITSINQEAFDFYPAAFVPYLSTIIIAISFVLYELSRIGPGSGIELLQSVLNNIRFRFDSNSFLSINMHKYNMNYQISNSNESIHVIIELILFYLMIILSVWDSLFSFYRYFSTKHVAVYLQEASAATIIRYFSLYAVPYVIGYILQIHVYYYLFPILIISHCYMNIWCNWNFSKLLIASTIRFAKTDVSTGIGDDVLKSVYFMRRMTMIWCFISSLCQTAFIMTHCIEIMYFYPFLWCIGCGAFTMNFVRNRHKISQHFLMCKFYFWKACTCRSRTIAIITPKQNSKTKPTIPKQSCGNGVNIKINCKSNIKVLDTPISACSMASTTVSSFPEDNEKEPSIEIIFGDTETHVTNIENGNKRNKTNVIETEKKEECMDGFDEFPILDMSVMTEDYDAKSHKALHLLGLMSASKISTIKKYGSKLNFLRAPNVSRRNLKIQSLSSKQLSQSIHMPPSFVHSNNRSRSAVNLQNNHSKDKSKRVQQTSDTEPTVERKRATINTLQPKLNLNSSRSKTCSSTPHLDIVDSKSKTPESAVPSLSLISVSSPRKSIAHMNLKGLLKKYKSAFNITSHSNSIKSEEKNNEIKLKAASKKDNNRPKNLDIDAVVSELNVLVGQGFYSRKGLISIQQLRKYHNNNNDNTKRNKYK